ncbi:MAG TPA: DMT family transporter, partial [Syntrophales bacterium]|nr:DMT family transporter [Syntrophales bacterium]
MKKPLSPALQGALWMISSAVVFSLMSVLVRIAAETQGVSAWKTAEFRFFISMVLVVALSFWLRDPLRFVNRPWLVSRGFFGGAAASIFFYSITQIGIAKATIFTYTYPIWAGLLAPFLLKDRIKTGVWAAVSIAFGGLYLIIVPSEGLGAVSWMDLLALSGGLLSGWAILSIKKLHETDTSRAILFSQCFFGLIIVEAPALPQGYSFTPIVWGTLLAIGLLATI